MHKLCRVAGGVCPAGLVAGVLVSVGSVDL